MSKVVFNRKYKIGFVTTQILVNKQQKNGLSAIVISLASLCSPITEQNVGVGRYDAHNIKYLAVTPELACANRHVGYLAPGEKASVIHFTFL